MQHHESAESFFCRQERRWQNCGTWEVSDHCRCIWTVEFHKVHQCLPSSPSGGLDVEESGAQLEGSRPVFLDKVLVCCVHGSCGAACKEYMCEIMIQSFRALDIWVFGQRIRTTYQRLIGSCPAPDASSNRSRCSRLSSFLPALPCSQPRAPLGGVFLVCWTSQALPRFIVCCYG